MTKFKDDEPAAPSKSAYTVVWRVGRCRSAAGPTPYSLDSACTNWAEEFFSRMRRAEIGHHHLAGGYLLRYAQEASWREDNRRASNGEQVNRISTLAMRHKPSVDFGGYWQRHVAR